MIFLNIGQIVISLNPTGSYKIVANPHDPHLKHLPVGDLLRLEANNLRLHVTNPTYIRAARGILHEMSETPRDPIRRRKLVIKSRLFLKLGDEELVLNGNHHMVDTLIDCVSAIEITDKSTAIRMTFKANQRVAHWLGRLCFLPSFPPQTEHQLINTAPSQKMKPKPEHIVYQVQGLSDELVKKLVKPVDELEMPVRYINTLQRNGLSYTWQLVVLRELGLREPGSEHKRCIGPKGINMIKKALEVIDLRFDTRLDQDQREALQGLSEAHLRQRAP